MKKRPSRRSFKILKWIGIGLGSLLLLMFLLPILFPGTIAKEVKDFANRKLTGELNFSEARLSFFDHFPSLTVTLDDFSLKGSAPFQNDTLAAAERIGFGINLSQLVFNGRVAIDEIYVDDADIRVLVNEKGEANYNVYIAEETQPTDTVSSASLRLDKIRISHCRLRYDDRSAKIRVAANDFNYLGKGDLDKAVFDLETEAEIGSLDFSYDGESYMAQKNVRAELTTRINTNALTFALQRNDLRINELPINFKGVVNILKSGYYIDVAATSNGSDLEDLFTALPPAYVKWLDRSKVAGTIDLMLALKGRYDASTNRSPTLKFHTRITDGYIQYKDAPLAASDIQLNLDAALPSLDPEDFYLKLSPFSFKLGNDQFRSTVELKKLGETSVKAQMKGGVDLAVLNRALGISLVDVKGKLDVNIQSNGTYSAARHLFPTTTGRFNWTNGYLKTAYYPEPISDLNLNLTATNQNGRYADTKIAIRPASFTFAGHPFRMEASFSNLDDVAYDLSAKGTLDIGRLYRVFRQEGLDVDGRIAADVRLKGKQSDATSGRYNRLNNRGTLTVERIDTRMEGLPKTLRIEKGVFAFNREKMQFNTFVARYGQSDFTLDGQLINAINYFFEKKATLHGAFHMESDLLNLNEFRAPVATASSTPIAGEATATATGVALVPTNLDVSLTAHAKQVLFDTFKLNDVKGTVGVSGGKVILNGAQLGLAGATLQLDGSYDDLTPQSAAFDLRFRARDFDIHRAYDEIPMFREMATSAGSAQGIVSVDYNLKGQLGPDMSPIYPSLEGGGTVSLKKIKVKGLRLFNGLSRKTVSAIDDPDLSKVDIKTKIRRNVITIERTKMKIALCRLRIEGKTNFDGKLALRIRVGLPPFGLIGIPVAVTGTHTAPKFKVFSKKTEEIEEDASQPQP